MDELTETLIRARKDQGLTQAALADLAGISRRTLVAIEGGGDCTLSTLRRLLTVLRLDLQVSPATHRPPTLEDIQAENEALFQRSGRSK